MAAQLSPGSLPSAEELAAMSRAQLAAIARAFKVSDRGNKETLRDRLESLRPRADDAASSSSLGVTAASAAADFQAVVLSQLSDL